MKKISFFILFMLFSTFASIAAPWSCTNPIKSGSGQQWDCATCAGGAQQSACCAGGGLQSGCLTTNAPINKGLILLVIGGMGLGAVVVYKNKQSKLV